jgi:hypothetical protein
VAPPLILLLFLVLVVVVAIGLFVAGVGPFAGRKAQEPGYSEDPQRDRPTEKVPNPEQQAREKGEIFPPAR